MPDQKRLEPDREEQIARLVKAYEQRLRKSYPHTKQTIEQIERTAQEIGEQTKQDIQQQIVDASGKGMPASRRGVGVVTLPATRAR